MRFALPLLYILSGVSLLAACGGEDRATQETYSELVAVEDLRVGSVDDPEAAFTWFSRLEVGSDGRIFTLHPNEKLIRIHSPEGKLLGTAGGPGEGPGEFKAPGDLGLLGDTLWVLDYGTQRFTYFDQDGEYIGDRRIPITLAEDLEKSPPRPDRLLPDGTMLGRSPAWSRLVADGEITSSAIVRLDGDGSVIDTVTEYSLQNTQLEIANPEGPAATYAMQPFSDTELVEVSRHLPQVVRVRRDAARESDGYFFEVTSLSFDGDTIFHRRFSYEPVPLAKAAVDSAVERFAGYGARIGLSAASAEKQVRDGLYVPEFRPPVSAAVPGRDGSVWLRLVTTGGGARWLALTGTGEPLGTVELPATFSPMVADRDRLWGMDRDELDVPYIVRFALSS